MPDLGIGEALAAFGGSDLLAGLGSLFGIGDAAAAGAGAGALETGIGTIGAGAGGAAAGGAGLADIVGTGAGLAGGTAGLEGTLLAGGAAGGIPAAIGAGGATALGTALDFMGAPSASAFNPSALTPGIGAGGGGPGILTPAASTAQPVGAGGTSVFDTGTSAVPGVSGTGAPSAVTPAGASASSIAAPAGVTAPADATSASIPGATGATSVGGAPLNAAPSTSISDLLSNASSGAMKSLTNNPLGVALGVGGLGYNIINGQRQTANQKALAGDAATATANSNQMVASGEALQTYLSSGTLPAAYQAQVDQAINDAKTQAISNAAAQGQSTDPTQNTALAATLAGIDARRPGMQSQVASQLFSSGSSLVSAGQSAAGLSGSLYQTLVQNDTTAAANTGKAIATLAAALNGRAQASSPGTGGTTITVG